MAAIKRVPVDKFQDAIADVLKQFGQNVADVVLEEAVHATAEEVARVVASAAPVRTGAYRGSITFGHPERRGHKRTETVYADAPHYRLTHLLERPHALRNGGRSTAQPHWEQGEADAADMMIRHIEEALRK